MGFWGYVKQSFWGIFLFFMVPIGIYYLVKWDPIIGRDEDGEPSTLGYYVIFGVWWIVLVLILKYRTEAKDRGVQVEQLKKDWKFCKGLLDDARSVLTEKQKNELEKLHLKRE